MSFSACDYYIINPYNEDVGYIYEKDALDDGFKLCYDEKVFPYYYGRSQAKFTYGKDSLKQYFLEKYSNYDDTSESGFITFRFIVNCKGEAGRFVIHELGTDFQNKKFNEKIVANLYEHLGKLKDWQPIMYYDDKYDSFIHITFKIENGELLEILP